MGYKAITLSFLLLFAAGCATKAPSPSVVTVKETAVYAAVSKDFVKFLKKSYLPAKTVFYLQKGTDSFGKSLANELIKAGYGVSFLKKRGSIPVAYTLDYFQDRIRVTYTLGDKAVTRLYDKTAKPLTGFAVGGKYE